LTRSRSRDRVGSDLVPTPTVPELAKGVAKNRMTETGVAPHLAYQVIHDGQHRRAIGAAPGSMQGGSRLLLQITLGIGLMIATTFVHAGCTGLLLRVLKQIHAERLGLRSGALVSRRSPAHALESVP
jgi:hypothetical protein